MPLIVNLRHLEAHSLRLEGELPVAELDIETGDEMVRAVHPLVHDVEVQRLPDALLLRGRLRLVLECQCVRCLKPFRYALALDMWSRHLPLQGEESVPVVNDCVDLTPWIREDILLEFPQHPLCDPECRGLPKTWIGTAKQTGGPGQKESSSPAWTELNKLKL